MAWPLARRAVPQFFQHFRRPIMAILITPPRSPLAAGKPRILFRFAVALNMDALVSSVRSMISMTSIDHANLARLNLNLLVAFDALLTERSVTRAAARIGLG